METVYDQAGPAVVNITSRVIAYDRFIQPIPRRRGLQTPIFLYDTEGHIVTNYQASCTHPARGHGRRVGFGGAVQWR